MERVVRAYSGGTVSSDGKFDAINVNVLVFATGPRWAELCDPLCSRIGEISPTVMLRMEGRYDAGIGSREYFVMMPLSCEMEWSTGNHNKGETISGEFDTGTHIIGDHTTSSPISRDFDNGAPYSRDSDTTAPLAGVVGHENDDASMDVTPCGEPIVNAIINYMQNNGQGND
uniref:Uncharacterized protein n=1 Tax=Oryza brachyantha TaxID=4533 RepID=J3MRY9_ORYBR